MAQEQLSAVHMDLQGAGDGQSHPCTAPGPRDAAGGQLELSGVPDALNSPANSLLAPSGAALGQKGTADHCWGSAENGL